MISLKKYLDLQQVFQAVDGEPEGKDLLCMAIDAYGSALAEMGNCSLDACPGDGRRPEEKSRRTEDVSLIRHELRIACGDRHAACRNNCAFGDGTLRGTISKRLAK